eukprot:scaffold243964_cov27-Tisochrysis_lutea.AAC.2
MRDIVQRSLIELPLAIRVHGQHGCHISSARYDISAHGQRRTAYTVVLGGWQSIWTWHDEAMLLKPPIVCVKLPAGLGSAASLDQHRFERAQPDPARAWIVDPEPPVVGPSAG